MNGWKPWTMSSTASWVTKIQPKQRPKILQLVIDLLVLAAMLGLMVNRLAVPGSSGTRFAQKFPIKKASEQAI